MSRSMIEDADVRNPLIHRERHTWGAKTLTGTLTLTEEEAADEQPQASVAPRRQPRTTVVDEKVRRQGERQQQRTEDAVDRATDRAVDKATDKVLNKLFGG